MEKADAEINCCQMIDESDRFDIAFWQSLFCCLHRLLKTGRAYSVLRHDWSAVFTLEQATNQQQGRPWPEHTLIPVANE